MKIENIFLLEMRVSSTHVINIVLIST